jgi:hypothetical protein
MRTLATILAFALIFTIAPIRALATDTLIQGNDGLLFHDATSGKNIKTQMSLCSDGSNHAVPCAGPSSGPLPVSMTAKPTYSQTVTVPHGTNVDITLPAGTLSVGISSPYGGGGSPQLLCEIGSGSRQVLPQVYGGDAGANNSRGSSSDGHLDYAAASWTVSVGSCADTDGLIHLRFLGGSLGSDATYRVNGYPVYVPQQEPARESGGNLDAIQTNTAGLGSAFTVDDYLAYYFLNSSGGHAFETSLPLSRVGNAGNPLAVNGDSGMVPWDGNAGFLAGYSLIQAHVTYSGSDADTLMLGQSSDINEYFSQTTSAVPCTDVNREPISIVAGVTPYNDNPADPGSAAGWDIYCRPSALFAFWQGTFASSGAFSVVPFGTTGQVQPAPQNLRVGGADIGAGPQSAASSLPTVRAADTCVTTTNGMSQDFTSAKMGARLIVAVAGSGETCTLSDDASTWTLPVSTNAAGTWELNAAATGFKCDCEGGTPSSAIICYH